jgi:hypothetical protein
MTKKLYFPRNTREYLDKIENLSEEDKEYYKKFNDEYYANSISIQNTSLQLHNTPSLVKQVYNQTNARGRDIMSKSFYRVDETIDSLENQPKENKYSQLLKTSTFNETIIELFDDYSLEISSSVKSHGDALMILKRFYVEIGRVQREEAKFKKQKFNRIDKEGK